MAKDSKQGKMAGPLYESGKTNGPAEGPKGGKSPGDPLGYLKKSGSK